MRKTLITAIILVIAASLFLVREIWGSDRVLRVNDGKVITFARMMEEVKEADLLFIGENHDDMDHHRYQLKAMKMLDEMERPLAIGLEMFPVGVQPQLDAWVAGSLNRRRFIRLYYENWQMPWPLYRDIFLYARSSRIPMVALNVPREITAQVARQGFASLSAEQRGKLPAGITCNVDKNYMSFISQAYAYHGKDDRSFTYFCEAQMVWDKAMAQHLDDYLKKNRGRTVVVIAGGGHAMKGGIPRHIPEKSNYVYKVILPEMQRKVTIEQADYLILE